MSIEKEKEKQENMGESLNLELISQIQLNQ
jgi:hypothetical protein